MKALLRPRGLLSSVVVIIMVDGGATGIRKGTYVVADQVRCTYCRQDTRYACRLRRRQPRPIFLLMDTVPPSNNHRIRRKGKHSRAGCFAT